MLFSSKLYCFDKKDKKQRLEKNEGMRPFKMGQMYFQVFSKLDATRRCTDSRHDALKLYSKTFCIPPSPRHESLPLWEVFFYPFVLSPSYWLNVGFTFLGMPAMRPRLYLFNAVTACHENGIFYLSTLLLSKQTLHHGVLYISSESSKRRKCVLFVYFLKGFSSVKQVAGPGGSGLHENVNCPPMFSDSGLFVCFSSPHPIAM